jgi:hypothetical protein
MSILHALSGMMQSPPVVKSLHTHNYKALTLIKQCMLYKIKTVVIKKSLEEICRTRFKLTLGAPEEPLLSFSKKQDTLLIKFLRWLCG